MTFLEKIECKRAKEHARKLRYKAERKTHKTAMAIVAELVEAINGVNLHVAQAPGHVERLTKAIKRANRIILNHSKQ